MDEPRFVVDCMLGRLSRWLCMLGYDTVYVFTEGRTRAGLSEKALSEGRILLTRDTLIPETRGLRKIVLRDQRFEAQLARVFNELGLRPDKEKIFTRCVLCNMPVVPMPGEEALPLVPELVRTLKTDFFRCRGCGRIYWRGTHTENTLKKLERMRREYDF